MALSGTPKARTLMDALLALPPPPMDPVSPIETTQQAEPVTTASPAPVIPPATGAPTNENDNPKLKRIRKILEELRGKQPTTTSI